MASKAEIVKVLMVLASAFPNFKPGRTEAERKTRLAEMATAYHLILGDLDATALMRVAVHLGSTQTFFPAAGEIRRAYFNLQEIAQGIPSADEAWSEVKGLFAQGFSRYNPPRPDDLSHPRIYKALEGIGGWLAFCNSSNDAADRARFIQAYETHTKREREEVRMLPQVRELVAQMTLEGPHRPALPEPDEEAIW